MDIGLLKKHKYIAIKPKGLNHYIWFETEKVNILLDVFIGANGWGKGGALTSIVVSERDIEGFIYSEDLQYI